MDGAVQLETGDLEGQPQTLPPNTDGWLIYYKTDVKVKDAAKSYTFSLIDDKGVSSDPKTVYTAKVKAKDVKLYSIVDSEITNPGSENMPNSINTSGASDITLKAKTETAGAKITGKVEKKDGGSWPLVTNINSNNQNNVDIKLTAPEPDKEILYRIAVTAGGDGFVSSAEKTFYVKVTKTQTITITGGENAWKKLKKEAEGPNGPGTIIIEGEITATNAADNSGEITITRDLTIKGKAVTGTDTLNANSNHTSTTPADAPAQKHRIFTVQDGATLTLENLTLKNGQAESGNGGGAIYAEGALTMKKCKVTGNIAYAGNGGGIYAGGALTMTECEVTYNTVDSTSLGGGGVYIYKPGKSISRTMENCTVSYNTAKQGNGGGIYTADKLTMTDCIIKNNTANSSSQSNTGHGGGVYTTDILTMTKCNLEENVVVGNGNGGGISINKVIGNVELKMTDCTLTGNKTAHGSGGGISVVSSDLEMTNCTLTDNDGGNNGSGGGVYVGKDGKFTMKGSSRITPSTGADKNKKGKNDVFLTKDKKIKLIGTLTGTSPVARITVEHTQYEEGKQVLDGTPELLNSEHGKFTVTPKSGGGWKVNNQGKLEMKPGGGSSGKTINGADADAWKQLKKAVASAAEDSTITIIGEITAKNGSDTENRGQIEIKKNITIERAASATSAMLNANRVDLVANAHRIFVVKNGAKLTLKGLTLKGGIAPSGAHGGAILVPDGGGAELSDCTIEDCETGNGGSGGGISISGTANLTGCAIKSCTAVQNGGGIYTQGTLTMDNCTLTGNKAKANGGGGVFVGSNAKKFTMKGSSCITPSTAPDKGKNDVFLAGGRMITIEDVLNPADGIAARITVGTTDYNPGTKVLDGSKVSTEHDKFTVTRGGSPLSNWKVNNQGKLEKN